MCLCCVIKCEQEIEAEDTYLAVPKHVRTLSYPFHPHTRIYSKGSSHYIHISPSSQASLPHIPRTPSSSLPLPSLLCPLPCSC